MKEKKTTKKIKNISLLEELDLLSQKLLRLESHLNSNIPTTLWISDLHGEGDRFKSILRGRFGMLYQTCKEALPKTFGTEKIQYLVRVIRKKEYFADPEHRMDVQDVILCLIQVLRYKLSNIQYRVDEVILPEFKEVIDRMISGLPVPDLLYEEPILSARLVAHLSHTIKMVLLDGIVVLGDIFDRGPQPDKIIRILASKPYYDLVHYVFGNHDILWVGAASGNRSLIAETFRVTCRYDHFELMDRLGFDYSKLKKFAVATYPPDLVKGRFKAKTDQAKSMEKALSIIQFKLEEETIKAHPEFDMQNRLWLGRLAKMLESNDTEGLYDTHFPTLDFQDPAKLSDAEEEIIEDLTRQFVTNKKLKRLLRFFFEKGETYHIHNNILNIHALIPSTQDGDFEEFMGRKGKQLLEWIQSSIVRIGEAYLSDQPQIEEDQALMFYLWCGPKSPFFGKVAMKTFERYFIKDQETHKEPSLYWNQNLKTKEFKEKIMAEFGTKRVIYGHTPVDVTKGKSMASEDGMAINVDGGFAAAYYNRGHALVHTPHQLYGIILPTPEEMIEAQKTSETVPLSVELIDEFNEPIKVKDTFKGLKFKNEAKELLEKIRGMAEDYERNHFLDSDPEEEA